MHPTVVVLQFPVDVQLQAGVHDRYLFDLEIAFLFPWAIVLGEQSDSGFRYVAMVVFLGILVVGFVYEWMKGALDWE